MLHSKLEIASSLDIMEDNGFHIPCQLEAVKESRCRMTSLLSIDLASLIENSVARSGRAKLRQRFVLFPTRPPRPPPQGRVELKASIKGTI